MKVKEKFFRFVGVWFTYLMASTVLIKWVLAPMVQPGVGDVCVIVNVLVLLVAWVVAFFNWGPIRGNWKEVASGH